MTCAVKNCLLGSCKPGCPYFHRPLGVSEERQRELSKACDEGQVRPFYCGTQSMDWRTANCDRCAKMPTEVKPGEFLCEIDFCISYAAIASGTIPKEIADRMGCKDGPPRRCGEWVEAR